MPATVVLDEMHLTFRIPARLPDAAAVTIRRTLTARRFTAAVRRAVLAVIRQRSALKPVRVVIGR